MNFIGFGAIAVTKPYKFIGFGDKPSGAFALPFCELDPVWMGLPAQFDREAAGTRRHGITVGALMQKPLRSGQGP
jgi:hypothetical protein